MALEQDPGASVPGQVEAGSLPVEVPLYTDMTQDAGPRDEVFSQLVAIGPSLLPDPPSGWSDVVTGTDGPRYWDRVFSAERARTRRYKRPTTVALVEIVGLDRLARQWGRDVAERALVGAARTLAREIRPSDHVARVEPTRFAILLTETTEIDAINFIERARTSCEHELHAASDFIRIAFGWASPPSKGDLADALEMATTRLEREIRHLG